MLPLRRFLSRAICMFGRRRLEQDFENEIRDHLASLEQRYLDQGMPADEARSAARRAFGGIDLVKEANRDQYVYMPTSACPFRSEDGFVADRNSRMMGVVARLKPGVSIEAARADLNVIANRLQQDFPESYSKSGGYSAAVIGLKDQLTHDIRPTLWVLLCTAGFVLLIVCASVANLTLARMLQRDREISVRRALGASRSQLLRQLLTESTLLALIGGMLGLAVAFLGSDLLIAFASRFTTRAAEIRMDGSVLLFTAFVSIFTGLIFGCIPGFTSRRDVAGALRAASRHTSDSSRYQALRNALIVMEVAVAFVLLTGAGLMIRSLIELAHVDLGVRQENILTVKVNLNWSKYRDNETIRRFWSSVLERLQAIPAVTAAGAGSTFPLNDQRPSSIRLKFRDRPADEALPVPQADGLVASPGYFQALGIQLLEGRGFAETDRIDSQHVAVVNRTMARHYWGSENPLGRQFSADDGRTWVSVVGVVADSRKALDLDVEDTFYYPLQQFPFASTIVIRTAGTPANAGNLVRAAVHSVDPNQPVEDIRTLEQIRSDSMTSPRVTMMLLSLFAALALLITATGIGGVIGFFVNQRKHEIGIRMALGAARSAVLWMVLREGLILVSLGLSIGFAGAFGIGHLMSGLLFRVNATDPSTFLATALVVAAAAAGACFVPAYRAAGIDPTNALRND